MKFNQTSIASLLPPPRQVPQWYMDEHCAHIHDPDRRLKCGMIAAMDEAVANVTGVLQERGLMNDTFLLFFSDNGGPVHVAGSNWPLRGSKTTLWEGGTRSPSFVHAPSLLTKSGTTYEEMVHVADWYPTFVEAAGGDLGNLSANLDGVSQWRNLLAGSSPGPRTEFVYNFDEVYNNSALRQGRFKLVQGHPGNPNGWFAPEELGPSATTEDLSGSSAPHPEYQLFNLHRDPLEKKDVLHSHPDVFRQMKARLEHYRESLVPANLPGYVSESAPSHFNNVWSPGWC